MENFMGKIKEEMMTDKELIDRKYKLYQEMIRKPKL